MKNSSSEKKQPQILIIGSLLSLFVLAGLFYTIYGRLFLDAGFYLNSAREVFTGKLPYRDFFFVQGPVYPYVYGLILKFLGYSVLTARLVSLLFGFLAIFLAGWTAGKHGGRNGTVIAVAALVTVPYQAYFFTSIKLYALTGLFLMATFAVLSSGLRSTLRYSLGLMFAVIAASTRLTLIPMVLIIVVYVVSDSYQQDRRIPWIPLLLSVVTAACIAGPFLIADHEAMLYSLIGIHTSASSGPNLFPFSKQLIVLAKLIIFYPILTLSTLFLLSRSGKTFKLLNRLDWTMIASILCITTVHLTANWFSMGYQSLAMPLTAACIGSLTARHKIRFSRPLVMGTLLLIAVTWFASWNAPVWRRDVTLTRSLDFIRQSLIQHCPENGTVAACNGVFAIEAHRSHAMAFGGAPFTYTPHWDDQQCIQFGGMNNSMIIDQLKQQKIAALLLESTSFSVGFPGFYPVEESTQKELFDTIKQYYKPVAKMRSLGSGELDLIMYTPLLDGVK